MSVVGSSSFKHQPRIQGCEEGVGVHWNRGPVSRSCLRSSGASLTFAQDEVQGNENKGVRHQPVGNETRDAEDTSQQACIDLRIHLHVRSG